MRYRRSLVGDTIEYEVVACDIEPTGDPQDLHKWRTPQGRPAFKTVKQAHRAASLVVGQGTAR